MLEFRCALQKLGHLRATWQLTVLDPFQVSPKMETGGNTKQNKSHSFEIRMMPHGHVHMLFMIAVLIILG